MNANRISTFIFGVILMAQMILTSCIAATPLPSIDTLASPQVHSLPPTTSISAQAPASPLSPVSTYLDVSADEAKHLIQVEPGLVILDVRTKEEYDSGHLPGAMLIPVSELKARMDELGQDKAKKILVYCQTGFKSVIASKILAEEGFSSAYNLLGGIAAWTSVHGSVVSPGCG